KGPPVLLGVAGLAGVICVGVSITVVQHLRRMDAVREGFVAPTVPTAFKFNPAPVKFKTPVDDIMDPKDKEAAASLQRVEVGHIGDPGWRITVENGAVVGLNLERIGGRHYAGAFPKLRSLNLSRSNIDDETLTSLKPLTNLTVLTLDTTPIGDAG